MVIQIVDINWGVHHQLCSGARDPDDSHTVLWRGFRGLLQQRMQVPYEQPVAQIVRAELQFIALRRLASVRRRHDAGIEPEDIQMRLLRKEDLGGGPYGRKVREVELKSFNGAFGVRVRHFDPRNGTVHLLLRTRGDVDSRIRPVQDPAQILANAGTTASHEEDLEIQKVGGTEMRQYFVRLIGQVLLRQRGRRRVQVVPPDLAQHLANC
jgi:hypothetical protein